MRKRGCHACEHAGRKFPNYNRSPCATCEPVETQVLDADGRNFHIEEAEYSGESAREKDTAAFVADPALASTSSEALMLIRALRRIEELCGRSPLAVACVVSRSCGRRYSEIAARYGCTKNVVKHHLHRVCFTSRELAEALSVGHYRRAVKWQDEADVSIDYLTTYNRQLKKDRHTWKSQVQQLSQTKTSSTSSSQSSQPEEPSTPQEATSDPSATSTGSI